MHCFFTFCSAPSVSHNSGWSVTYSGSLVLSLCIRAHSTSYAFLTPSPQPLLTWRCTRLAWICVICMYSTHLALSVERSVSKSWHQTTSISCCHPDWLSAKAHIPDLSNCTIVSTPRHCTHFGWEKCRRIVTPYTLNRLPMFPVSAQKQKVAKIKSILRIILPGWTAQTHLCPPHPGPTIYLL